MLRVDEALARVTDGVVALRAEEVPLLDSLGRILAADVLAPRPLPPWPASAMDGFAVRASDVPGTLEVLETVMAGGWPRREVVPGTATRIMTGAPVPAGADAVVMVEDTRCVGERVNVATPARLGQHVRHAGSEVALGTRVLTAGDLLTPGALALLSGLGLATVEVRRRPRVAVFTTGDEVVEPGSPLLPGQIHGTNLVALTTLVREAGGEVVPLGNVPDDPAALRDAFLRASSCDVVLSTGGVSVGDHDHVKVVIAGAGGQVDFWRVAMKPGKPLAFGSIGSARVFGLPGNPVSCVVNFLVFVRPVLRMLQGDPRPHLPELTATWRRPGAASAAKAAPSAGGSSCSHGSGRLELVRVALSRGEDGGILATPAGHQGSANLLSLAGAHGLAIVPPSAQEPSDLARVLVFDPTWDARGAARYG